MEDEELQIEQLSEEGGLHIIVDRGQQPLRIDKFLFDKLAGISRNRIQEAADAGLIQVNGKSVKSNYRVKPGEDIYIELGYAPTDYTIEPEDIPLNIVYEDEQIIVVNKQAGLVVHPGHGNWNGTLLNALAWHLKDQPNYNFNDARIGLVHRIDKDTSGLLLIAKTPEAKTFLSKQFFDKTTSRTYNALVWGRMEANEGTIDGALARDNRDRTSYRVWDPEENPLAKHAVTHWKVLERFAYCTLVECRLETGRTHQIRVHMAHIGHPLFADLRYGGCEILKGQRTQKYKQYIKNCMELCPRQALHAKTLGFEHPTNHERMLFDSEWPEDFNALIEKWRHYSPTETAE